MGGGSTGGHPVTISTVATHAWNGRGSFGPRLAVKQAVGGGLCMLTLPPREKKEQNPPHQRYTTTLGVQAVLCALIAAEIGRLSSGCASFAWNSNPHDLTGRAVQGTQQPAPGSRAGHRHQVAEQLATTVPCAIQRRVVLVGASNAGGEPEVAAAAAVCYSNWPGFIWALPLMGILFFS